MRWSREQLEAYLTRPGKPHALYGTEKPIYDVLAAVTRALRR